MISNITNTLPALLKHMQNNEQIKNPEFSLTDSINFYKSILPKKKDMDFLKHLHLDCIFKVRDEYIDIISNFNLSVDSLEFLKDFYYEANPDNGLILIRSNYEELAILSMILIGSIKELKPEEKNRGIFISLAQHFLTYCLNSGYEICKSEDLAILEKYNDDFDKNVFENITFVPTPEANIGTIHFVGIEFNKDILKIFEEFKNVKFTYNEENASFIITMKACDWDKFWNDAPQYLKNEFMSDDNPTRLNLC